MRPQMSNIAKLVMVKEIIPLGRFWRKSPLIRLLKKNETFRQVEVNWDAPEEVERGIVSRLMTIYETDAISDDSSVGSWEYVLPGGSEEEEDLVGEPAQCEIDRDEILDVKGMIEANGFQKKWECEYEDGRTILPLEIWSCDMYLAPSLDFQTSP